jgi:uncharacterized protein with HEPN domain
MRRKTPKWLDDIRASCEFILAATEGKSLEDYRSDALLRAAAERHFEIIGEAMGRIARHDPETAARVGDFEQIIAFRNVLIHGYDLVDEGAVWKVVGENLPVLRDEVAGLLREAEGGPPDGEST